MKRYFIIGTDTDCGKTYATCQMVNSLRHSGFNALAIKPVASGCIEQDGLLISQDAQLLEQANGISNITICPWRFKPPISPHLAAAELGVNLSAQMISDFCLSPPVSDLDYLLIEGAGGLMVPLNPNETWIDVLMMSKIPVILVVGMRIGCINHALLTASVLASYQIPCIGWIANCIDNHMLALSENISTLFAKLSCPLLMTIPFNSQAILAPVPLNFNHC